VDFISGVYSVSSFGYYANLAAGAGSSRFSSTMTAIGSFTAGRSVLRAVVADFDGDSIPDVAVAVYFDPNTLWFKVGAYFAWRAQRHCPVSLRLTVCAEPGFGDVRTDACAAVGQGVLRRLDLGWCVQLVVSTPLWYLCGDLVHVRASTP
jgi:hypothetical protein